VSRVKLREVAFSRAGDKGDISNVSVIPYAESDWEWIREQVTVARVVAVYGPLVRGPIERYELPGIKALNFVMRGALEGGVSRTLALDLHGKSRGALMGTIEVERPEPPGGVQG
jgi:hypothetical protein